MRQKLTAALGLGAALLAACLLLPEITAAHGLAGRADLPIPQYLFAYGATIVLIVSFAALGALWREPKLAVATARPLAGVVGRAIVSTPVQAVCGGIGAALLGLVIYSGFVGSEQSKSNFAPTFVFIIFWVGMVPASILFGDVFRAFNPWRAIGRFVGWVVGPVARDRGPLRAYPDRLGRWPAAIGLAAFAWFEIASVRPDSPTTLATAVLVYSLIQFTGMAVYGVSKWSDNCEAFGAYFGLIARIAPVTVVDRRIAFRVPLSGLATGIPRAGTAALIFVAVGSTSFDGGAESDLWLSVVDDIQSVFKAAGFGLTRSLQAANTVGLIAAIAIVSGLFRVGAVGVRRAASRRGKTRSQEQSLDSSTRRWSGEFVLALVPIAVAYVLAHYFSLLGYEGQRIIALASDPLGQGDNLFGTSGNSVNYTWIRAAGIWYVQVGVLVVGHVAGLIIAHDRAVAVFGRARAAALSQQWMLGVMVAFTTLAMWLLSNTNQ